MFRRSVSLAIPHRKSFAAIPSVPLVHLGQTNRSVSASHKSQHEISLILALSRPIPDYQQRDIEKRYELLFRRACVFLRFVGRSHRTIRIRIRIAAKSHDTMLLRNRAQEEGRKSSQTRIQADPFRTINLTKNQVDLIRN